MRTKVWWAAVIWGLVAAGSATASGLPDPPAFDGVPADGSVGFPHDGAPLVRWRSGSVPEDAFPALYDAADTLVPSTRTEETPGSFRWVRVTPNEPLLEGVEYTLRAAAPDLDVGSLDDDVPPIRFETGPSLLDEPPPTARFELYARERECEDQQGCDDTRCMTYMGRPVTGSPAERFRTLRFRRVGSDDGFVAVIDGDDHEEFTFLDFERGPELDEVCWEAVAQDAYGRESEPFEDCAEPESFEEAWARGAMLLPLLLVPGLGRRRR